jgi:hypothetical protein
LGKAITVNPYLSVASNDLQSGVGAGIGRRVNRLCSSITALVSRPAKVVTGADGR